jgi:putative endonuclease
MSTRSVGAEAEQRAVRFLEGQGYRVIHRNYACRMGEVDLICEDGETLAFVEVRYRKASRYGYPEETITREKKRRIANTARYFLLERKLPAERECRFDVVSILGENEPILQKNAFEEDTYRSR